MITSIFGIIYRVILAVDYWLLAFGKKRRLPGDFKTFKK
jgi:hypothetical protein